MRFLHAPVLLLLLAPPSLAVAQPSQPAPLSPAEMRRAMMDQLFDTLREAGDEESAALIELRIRGLWAQGASPAAALLLRRGQRNLQAGVPEEALEDLDAALTLQDDYAEAWLLRAQALAATGEPAAAARDIQQALRIEPRHFIALQQLSALQESVGDPQGALHSHEAVLALHPRIRGGQERLRELRRRALGDST